MKNLRILLGLTINYLIDYFNYIRYSGIFRKNTEEKLLAYITFTYHTIEKGFSMPTIRYGFGKKKIEILLVNISLYIKHQYNTERSQFIAASSVLKKYYDLHLKQNYNLENFFTKKDYIIISEYAIPDIGGAITIKKEDYFKNSSVQFDDFVNSRHSVRYFSNKLINEDAIKKAVDLANHCPSACNRQSSKVYLINSKTTVEKILKIQKGVLATADQIRQLLIVTSNRSCFFTSGERNQLFIDGGIFLESLLLCLHNKNIAACTLHWSLNNRHDNQIKELVHLSRGEKVVALIAIGYLADDIKVPYSYRKPVDELFIVQN